MNLTESLLTAFDSLITNRMRAVLTMLGVIIGVAAVIALLSVGNGVSASIEGQIQGIDNGNDAIGRAGSVGQDPLLTGQITVIHTVYDGGVHSRIGGI